MTSITLRYFAQLRELTQCDSETIETEARSASELYAEMQQKYTFPHQQDQLMIAINGDFSSWNTPLTAGDEVAFIPPVAGG